MKSKRKRRAGRGRSVPQGTGIVQISCSGDPSGAIILSGVLWCAALRLARRKGDLRAEYTPQEAIRLGRALRRGGEQVGQRNDFPYRAFADPEARFKLWALVAMCEQGRGLTVRPGRSYGS
jgi:hypothetical protein